MQSIFSYYFASFGFFYLLFLRGQEKQQKKAAPPGLSSVPSKDGFGNSVVPTSDSPKPTTLSPRREARKWEINTAEKKSSLKMTNSKWQMQFHHLIGNSRTKQRRPNGTIRQRV